MILQLDIQVTSVLAWCPTTTSGASSALFGIPDSAATMEWNNGYLTECRKGRKELANYPTLATGYTKANLVRLL
jgi:hypothetical protein